MEMLLDYLWRYRVMKLKDKVKEIEPELVNDKKSVVLVVVQMIMSI